MTKRHEGAVVIQDGGITSGQKGGAMVERTGVSVPDLAKVDLFSGLGDRWLWKIKNISREQVFAPNTIVFSTGSVAEDIYVVLE